LDKNSSKTEREGYGIMANKSITYGELLNLKAKELREWGSIEEVTIRNIKYLLQGNKGDKIAANRNVRHWCRYFEFKKEETLFYPIALILLNASAEKDVQVRLEMYKTIYLFMRYENICYDSKYTEILEEHLSFESEKGVAKEIKSILSWNNMFNSGFLLEIHRDKLISKYFSKELHETEEIVTNSTFFTTPLPYKQKKKAYTGEAIGAVYFVREKEKGRIKIGKASNINTKKFFPVKPPFEWELIHTIEHHEFSALEIYFHKLFKSKRVNGEWFSLDSRDIKKIKSFDSKVF